MGFQWDEEKAHSNVAKHGVTFEAAVQAFADPFAFDWLDQRFPLAEPRYCLLGMVEGRLLFVAYAERGDDIRIISARLAESYERRRYYADNV